MWKKLKGAYAAVANPEDYAEHRLSGFIDTIWNGDQGESYDDQLAKAMTDMDAQDGVTVKRDKSATAGGEIGSDATAGLSAELGKVTESETTLNKATGAEGKTTPKEDKGKLKVEGTLNLEKIAGLKGKAEYERKWHEGKAEGELKVELGGGTSNWGAVCAVIGATIFSKMFEWIGSQKAHDGGLDGFGQSVFAYALTGVAANVDNAVAASAVGSKAEAKVGTKWRSRRATRSSRRCTVRATATSCSNPISSPRCRPSSRRSARPSTSTS